MRRLLVLGYVLAISTLSGCGGGATDDKQPKLSSPTDPKAPGPAPIPAQPGGKVQGKGGSPGAGVE